MKHLVLLTFLFGLKFIFCQTNFAGVWQGIMLKEGQKEIESQLIYVKFLNNSGVISGKSREEVYNTEFYALQPIKGINKDNHIEFKQTVIESKKSSSKITWCSAEFKGDFIDSSGYIIGTYKSATCKRNSGKFILYRSKVSFSETTIPSLGHAWRDVLLQDLKLKRKAPEIREMEMLNFKFQPVYFDHDKAELKSEYKTYLFEMIQVVNGHSDLRIQITGHTDADGSILYNQDLSRRRADAIKLFFQLNGFDLKKLIVDFKGELEPVDNNKTDEGKGRNRRVDFKFI